MNHRKHKQAENARRPKKEKYNPYANDPPDAKCPYCGEKLHDGDVRSAFPVECFHMDSPAGGVQRKARAYLIALSRSRKWRTVMLFPESVSVATTVCLSGAVVLTRTEMPMSSLMTIAPAAMSR